MRKGFEFIGAVAAASCLICACSFDYGALSDESPGSIPNVVMNDVEYVRVRGGKAVVRLQAESVERFENDGRMVVTAPRFEQFSSDGSDGAVGGASAAVVHVDSGDVDMSGGVSLSVPEEEVVIETEALSWKDEDRVLRGAADKPVLVKKSDGSFLSGVGFSADARSKSWVLTGAVSGTLVEEDEKSPSGERAP
jgi:LPS export ABC transporter protein LptC